MRRTEWLQETRKMRFEEAYEGWQARRLTQEEAARLLGVCERTFRCYLDRYEEAGLEGLIDKRLEQVSQRRAPVDEVLAVTERYRRRHLGWNVKHFYAWYRREGGGGSYSWVKNTLQRAGLVTQAVKEGGYAPHAPGTGSLAWDDAASGREYSRVGSGPAVGFDCDDGRCHQ